MLWPYHSAASGALYSKLLGNNGRDIVYYGFFTEIGCLNLKKYECWFNYAYFIFQSITTFPELVKVLSHFCCNPDPDDQISFEAAVLLGRLCVSDDNAKFKLKQSLEYSEDTHVKAKVNNNGCTKLTFTPI